MVVDVTHNLESLKNIKKKKKSFCAGILLLYNKLNFFKKRPNAINKSRVLSIVTPPTLQNLNSLF